MCVKYQNVKNSSQGCLSSHARSFRCWKGDKQIDCRISIAKILRIWQYCRKKRKRNTLFERHTILIEFFTIGVSVRLSDRSLHGEEQKKNRQKLPPVGIKTRNSGSSGQCLTNWARQESVGQGISEVSFVLCTAFTCWTLFISRKGHEDSGWQLNVDLAQLVRHWPHDLEILVSNPAGGNFWGIFLRKDLSDNLTETPIVKNSNILLQTFTWNHVSSVLHK